jgi:hypothetical protein
MDRDQIEVITLGEALLQRAKDVARQVEQRVWKIKDRQDLVGRATSTEIQEEDILGERRLQSDCEAGAMSKTVT